jgi:ornithine cyclodeaminase
VAVDLETAVRTADIILTCTMTTEPIIKGAWLRPGQHLNMIGAYRPDMREADDEALQKSRLFVDSFDTTLSHIGELKIPLETGVISHDHVLADYYNLATFQAGPDDITVFKNGGGAHLDLMTARYVLDRWHS